MGLGVGTTEAAQQCRPLYNPLVRANGHLGHSGIPCRHQGFQEVLGLHVQSAGVHICLLLEINQSQLCKSTSQEFTGTEWEEHVTPKAEPRPKHHQWTMMMKMTKLMMKTSLVSKEGVSVWPR